MEFARRQPAACKPVLEMQYKLTPIGVTQAVGRGAVIIGPIQQVATRGSEVNKRLTCKHPCQRPCGLYSVCCVYFLRRNMARLHIRFTLSFSVVIGFVIFISFIDVAGAALTRTPRNAIGLQEDSIVLKCFTNSSYTTWRYRSLGITGRECNYLDSTSTTTSSGNATHCALVVQGTRTTRRSGPYVCSDGADTAEAVVIIIDPTPTCGVTSSGPIFRGEDVTLTCSMTYYYRSRQGTRPHATLSASIAWQSGVGTSTTNKSVTQADEGVKLQVDVTTLASGTEIPSYNCTSTFHFRDNRTKNARSPQLALNSVSWTCVSEPVLISYCPSSVTVNPSSGPYEAGDVLTCVSDGHPQPSYTWTDSDGDVVSTASTTTLFEGPFNFTCTATGNFNTPCSASSIISGNATAAPAGNELQPLTIIIIVVCAIGLLIVVIIILLLIVCCRKRGKARIKEDSKPIAETNIEMTETGDFDENVSHDAIVQVENVPQDASVQDSVVCNGRSQMQSIEPGYINLPFQTNAQKSEATAVSAADEPQYAEVKSRRTNAAPSSQNPKPPKKPDEPNYAAILHKARNQLPSPDT